VARPDRTRKSQVFDLSASGFLHLPVAYTKPASTTMITAVRTSVARSESTPSSPSLAKIAVSAANTADQSAQ
jgi:hypothetical protein